MRCGCGGGSVGRGGGGGGCSGGDGLRRNCRNKKLSIKRMGIDIAAKYDQVKRSKQKLFYAI